MTFAVEGRKRSLQSYSIHHQLWIKSSAASSLSSPTHRFHLNFSLKEKTRTRWRRLVEGLINWRTSYVEISYRLSLTFQSSTLRFHKDNLRHLSRFPDFFVTKRILPSSLVLPGNILVLTSRPMSLSLLSFPIFQFLVQGFIRCQYLSSCNVETLMGSMERFQTPIKYENPVKASSG